MDRGQSLPLGRERVLGCSTIRVGIEDTISTEEVLTLEVPYLLPLPHTDSVH